MTGLVAIHGVSELSAGQRRAGSPENGRTIGRGRRGLERRGIPHQRNRSAVLARLLRAAGQNEGDKGKVFHNPAASSGFMALARGL